MKTIEYWVVESCFDRDCTTVGCFTDPVAADAVAGGKNKMYKSVHKRTLTLFDSVEDYENNTREKLRERALSKLTTEEKIALGL